MSELTATQRLYDLIHEQRTILLELKHFAETQFQIVQENELGKLVSLLATKQQAIQRLQDVDRRLHPFRDQDPESRIWASVEQRDECRRLAKECPRLLADVMKLEQASEEILTRQREQVTQQVDQSVARSHAATAYLQTSQSPQTSSGWTVEE
jgi:flagellar biosynthesis/type III secretory pathway chaperone